MIPDIKERLLRVINDPHFSNRERSLAKSAIQRILELERKIYNEWPDQAQIALLSESQCNLGDKQPVLRDDRLSKKYRISYG
ncbi:MAG: hypothetical protein GY806_16210 [Gammaproteobacteria bacterium]|nr:hypothetical protein [Gammaproteobacteria bacterium]